MEVAKWAKCFEAVDHANGMGQMVAARDSDQRTARSLFSTANTHRGRPDALRVRQGNECPQDCLCELPTEHCDRAASLRSHSGCNKLTNSREFRHTISEVRDHSDARDAVPDCGPTDHTPTRLTVRRTATRISSLEPKRLQPKYMDSH